MKKKILPSMLFAAMMFGSVATLPAAALDSPSNGYPSGISYGNTSWSNYFPYPNVLVYNKWNQIGQDERYDSWDKDIFVATNASASVSLSTSNSSTYQISGSQEFNFAAVAKTTISGNWGQTWGKTTTVTYTAEKGYTYELWSANKIKRIYWSYPRTGYNTLTSQSQGSDGTWKWFFRHK